MASWPSRIGAASSAAYTQEGPAYTLPQGCGRLSAAAAVVLGLTLVCGGAASAAETELPGRQGSGKTIGLVLGDWRFALYQSENGKQECPQGFQYKQSENYAAQFPTAEAREAHGEQFGYYVHRGPQGENAFYFPTTVKDPLPFRAAQGPVALGLDLDDEQAGRGTAETLPHGNFTAPDGRKGIDNQLFRVIGCTSGWRKGGMMVGITSQQVRSEFQARLLLEVSGVDDERNDDAVVVTTYRGLDAIASDTQGRLLPWLSQRIDYKGGARYVQRLTGRIVDGVLITDPADARLPYYEQPDMAGDRDIHRMRLELKLDPAGAAGLLGGYVDVENWWLTYAKTWGAHAIADVGGWSGPATYGALRQYADYRDPETGQVTGISAAYEVAFARTFIIHSPKGDAAIAARLSPRDGVRATASR